MLGFWGAATDNVVTALGAVYMNATCRPEVIPIDESTQNVDKAGMIVGITFGVLLFITLVIAIAVVSSKAFCIKKYTSTEVEMMKT